MSDEELIATSSDGQELSDLAQMALSLLPQDSGNEDDVQQPNIDETEKDKQGMDQMVTHHQARIRRRMMKAYQRQHQVRISDIDEYVSVKVPKEDRASTDRSRLVCKVIDVPYEDRYRLKCKNGILTQLYNTGELNIIIDASPWAQSIEEGPEEEISLTRASRLDNSGYLQEVFCNCKGPCNTKKCHCKRQALKCTQYCHGSNPRACKNLDTVANSTQIGLVEKEPIRIALRGHKRQASTAIDPQHPQRPRNNDPEASNVIEIKDQ